MTGKYQTLVKSGTAQSEGCTMPIHKGRLCKIHITNGENDGVLELGRSLFMGTIAAAETVSIIC